MPFPKSLNAGSEKPQKSNGLMSLTAAYYFIAFIMSMCLIDGNVLHLLRTSQLLGTVIVSEQNGDPGAGVGSELNSAIMYWDYLRRLRPYDVSVLDKLATYYLMAGESEHARDTLKAALCLAQPGYERSEELLKAYKILAGDEKISCQKIF